jgi:hypothetical protein
MGGLNPYLLCANDAVNRYDPNGQLWWPITGTASVAFGWVLAQATGSSYTLTDAAIDFTLGAVGPGLIGQFKKLASLRKCIKVSAHLKAIKQWELTTKLDKATTIDEISKVATQVKKITQAEAKLQAVIDGKAYDLAVSLDLVGTKTIAGRILHGVNHAVIKMEGEATIHYETKGDGDYRATVKESPIKITVTTDPPGENVNPDAPPLL